MAPFAQRIFYARIICTRVYHPDCVFEVMNALAAVRVHSAGSLLSPLCDVQQVPSIRVTEGVQIGAS